MMCQHQNGLTANRTRILVLAMVAAFFTVLTFFALRMPASQDALSQMGSRGTEVRLIQQKLKKWGYFDGTVDGIYGPETKKAVIYFQQKNGLTADGVAGPATLRAMGLAENETVQTGGSSGYSQNEVELLANIISAEARGEPFEGQIAVGAVVLNRVGHPSFPDSISGVVYQPGAFTAITDGQIKVKVADSARRAAREALAGADPSGGAIYYYNPDKTSNRWIRTRPVIKRIGAHLFCR